MSGMPFLLPLLYQLGMGLPAWQSGLLMMPQAAAAITMKSMTTRILGRLGYRGVLTINTVLIGVAIATFSLIGPDTPKPLIIALALCLGAFNSLQFTSMNTLAYADVEGPDTSMASTLASSIQQLSMSVGLATGSLAAAWLLDGVSQSNRPLVLTALHHAFLVLAVVTVVSSIVFWKLRPTDGDAISKGRVKVEEPSG